MSSKKTVITYGTFDLFHIGHLNLLRRCKQLGDKLIVGISTDEFNAMKGKSSLVPYDERAAIVEAIRCVDLIIPEVGWEQKRSDIENLDVDVFVMGNDWQGKFDFLSDLCEVVYLPRTPGVSSTGLKDALSLLLSIEKNRS